MGVFPEDPDRKDDNCDWRVVMAARPNKEVDINMDLSRGSKQVQNKAIGTGKIRLTEKSVFKIKLRHADCCVSTTTFANDKMAYEATG